MPRADDASSAELPTVLAAKRLTRSARQDLALTLTFVPLGTALFDVMLRRLARSLVWMFGFLRLLGPLRMVEVGAFGKVERCRALCAVVPGCGLLAEAGGESGHRRLTL